MKTITLKFQDRDEAEMQSRAESFEQFMLSRRTVRDFSDRPVPKEVIESCLLTANSAPSGANRQPWHFVVVSDPALKKQIRKGAEEHEFYADRAPKDWLEALAPLGTDANKPFLETAPYLIVIFAQKYLLDEKGKKLKNYFVTESTSIAAGLLIAALHNAGLASLTHTPSPMKFLNTILGRPISEKPLMILVAGYPIKNVQVPAISRKPLKEIASFR